MRSFPHLSDTINELSALVVALSAALPFFWHDPEHSKGPRRAASILIALACVVWWPLDFADCARRGWYGSRWPILAALGAIAWVAEWLIHDNFGFDQVYKVGGRSHIHTLIGGPVLTKAAIEAQQRHALHGTKALLDHFGQDPDLVWPKVQRSFFRLGYSGSRVVKVMTMSLALLAAYAAREYDRETVNRHTRLHITPSAEQTVSPGGSVSFATNEGVCEPRPHWRIKGGSGEELGTVNDGFYRAPAINVLKADGTLDVNVIATLGGEEAVAVVHVRQPPEGISEYETRLLDINRRPVTLRPVIINQEHSWKYEKETAEGANGQEIIAELARGHFFDQYDDIVCLGTASREYDQHATPGKRGHALQEEDERAGRRAIQLASWVEAAVPDHRFRIVALKIGRYNAEGHPGSDVTAKERLMVLVGVKRRPGRIDMVAKLREGFDRLRPTQAVFGWYLDHYPPKAWQVIRA